MHSEVCVAGVTHFRVHRSRRPDEQSWASSQRCPGQWLTMPSWTQHPGQHGLQGVELHGGPWEPEEAPEPQRGEEVGKALWRMKHLS